MSIFQTSHRISFGYFSKFCFFIFGLLQLQGTMCNDERDLCTELTPCQNSGRCRITSGGYECLCMFGWEGVHCEINHDDCKENTCLNNGTCVDKPNAQFQCNCLPGFIGIRCEHPDECLNNPCYGDATCSSNTFGQFSCICPSGWEGADCSVDHNECSPETRSPCDHGVCINTLGSYECKCPVGYTGIRCADDIDECADDPCLNGGQCVDKIGEYKCVCSAGYSGDNCEHADDCVRTPCKNDGVCRVINGYYQCFCTNQWAGRYCDEPVTACTAKPCLHGGLCTVLPQNNVNEAKFVCQCQLDFYGNTCQFRKDNAVLTHSNNCLKLKLNCHHGRCEPRSDIAVGHYGCRCNPGYTGLWCNTTVNPCFHDPCLNDGRCVSTRKRANGYICICQKGTSGLQCEINKDDCAPNLCSGNSSCVDGINEYRCECLEGFYGKNCVEQDAMSHLPCTSNPCQHGATCINMNSDYHCQCRAGYTGKHCETNIDSCSSSRTLCNWPHGQCIDEEDGYRCFCDALWTGDNCNIKLDPCEPNPCFNHASCTKISASEYECRCYTASGSFTGKHCEIDVDECNDFPDFCKNNGQCTNTNGSFECVCPHGFYGQFCELLENICQPLNPCLHDGLCEMKEHNFLCHCPPGFEGERCEREIDECETFKPCHNNAICTDYSNSYTCTCPPGFSGRNCSVNDNDCSPSSCLNGGTCMDVVNGVNCFCAPGFIGTRCEYKRSVCEISQPCRNNATCQSISVPPFYHCRCSLNFEGQDCSIAINVCSQNFNICGKHGFCTSGSLVTGQSVEYQAFHCVCHNGWTGELCDIPQDYTCRRYAEERNVTTDVICLNRGICEDVDVNGRKAFRCQCTPQFKGSYCQQVVDLCSHGNPCENNGKCLNTYSEDQGNSYKCECKPGFEGARCDIDIDECTTEVCKNKGICYNQENGYKCSCPGGTMGDNCELLIAFCKPGNCLNNGICIEKPGGYQCNCLPGFEGDYCEINFNECSRQPCFINGSYQCIDGSNSFLCKCLPGYRGETCAERINFCETFHDSSMSEPCLNGGICISGSSSFVCRCPHGYAGDRCEFVSTSHTCAAQPCKHDGKCVHAGDNLQGFRCECKKGTGGPYCEYDTEDNCKDNLCLNGAGCQDLIGTFKCICSFGFCGLRCEQQGDKCQTANIISTGVTFYEAEARLCERRNCKHKKGNGYCDQDCNLAGCNWDGMDCSLGTVPYSKCQAMTIHNVACHVLHANKKCDWQCNSEACLFDGWDCLAQYNTTRTIPKCPNERYCNRCFGNNVCDPVCNNDLCSHDGGDCKTGDEIESQHAIIDGYLIIIVGVNPSNFKKFETGVLFKISQLLRTVVRVKRDDMGNEMIYTYKDLEANTPGKLSNYFPLEDPETKLRQRRAASQLQNQDSNKSKIYLEMDNTYCQEQCFHKVDFAAQFLSTSVSSFQQNLPVPIFGVSSYTSSESPGSPKTPSNLESNVVIILSVIIGAISILLISFMIHCIRTKVGHKNLPNDHFKNKSQRFKSVLWFPEGFSGNYKDSMKSERQNLQTSLEGTSTSFDDKDEASPVNMMGDTLSTSCGGGNTSLDATPISVETLNCSVSSFCVADTKCGNSKIQQHYQSQNLAAMNYSLFKLIYNTDGSMDEDCYIHAHKFESLMAEIVASQGITVFEVLNENGENLLHVAARLNRCHILRILLDCLTSITSNMVDMGSKTSEICNKVDVFGRTPLLSAAAADCLEAFSVLSICRLIHLDALDVQSDGLNALMIALRTQATSIVEYILFDHSSANRLDVNAKDFNGNTALHWAARTSQLMVMRVLLNKSGTIKDVQNSCEETALFLAAREGLYEACLLLLDAGVNRKLADNMERTPQDIARLNGFVEVADLLEQYSHPLSPSNIRVENYTEINNNKQNEILVHNSRKRRAGSTLTLNNGIHDSLDSATMPASGPDFGNFAYGHSIPDSRNMTESEMEFCKLQTHGMMMNSGFSNASWQYFDRDNSYLSPQQHRVNPGRHNAWFGCGNTFCKDNSANQGNMYSCNAQAVRDSLQNDANVISLHNHQQMHYPNETQFYPFNQCKSYNSNHGCFNYNLHSNLNCQQTSAAQYLSPNHPNYGHVRSSCNSNQHCYNTCAVNTHSFTSPVSSQHKEINHLPPNATIPGNEYSDSSKLETYYPNNYPQYNNNHQISRLVSGENKPPYLHHNDHVKHTMYDLGISYFNHEQQLRHNNTKQFSPSQIATTPNFQINNAGPNSYNSSTDSDSPLNFTNSSPDSQLDSNIRGQQVSNESNTLII